MPNSLLSPQKIIIASRESLLAMWQAKFIQKCLGELYPQTEVSILGMTTRGDQILDQSLAKIGGKGLFIKELEQALEMDCAGMTQGGVYKLTVGEYIVALTGFETETT